MYVAFDSLPQDAQIWAYQADRNLSAAEIERVHQHLANKLESWATHGSPMKAGADIRYNRVILLGADKNFQASSGCSMDNFTHSLRLLGQEMGVNFFDRAIGYFEGEEVAFFPFFDAKKWVISGKIKPDTKILNHQIGTKEELDARWITTAGESFLNKYFAQVEG